MRLCVVIRNVMLSRRLVMLADSAVLRITSTKMTVS